MRFFVPIMIVSALLGLGGCPTSGNNSSNNAPIGGNTQSPAAKFCVAMGLTYAIVDTAGGQSGECKNAAGEVVFTDAQYYAAQTAIEACQSANAKVTLVPSNNKCLSGLLIKESDGTMGELYCNCGNENTCYAEGKCSPIPSNNACSLGNGTPKQVMACKSATDFNLNYCAGLDNMCSENNSAYRWTCGCGADSIGNSQCWNATQCGAIKGSCVAAATSCGNGSTDTVPTCHVSGTSGSTLNGVTCS